MMKTEEDIFEIVRKIVATKAELDEDAVSMNKHFRDDLKISSIVIVSIVLAVETEFGIEIADEEIVTLATIGDAVRFIAERQPGA